MTLTITPQNGTSTLRWEVTADTAAVLAAATDAGKYIYQTRWKVYTGDPPELVEWDELNTAQKLEVLNQEITYCVKQMARSFHINDAKETAGETAASEADTLYDIG